MLAESTIDDFTVHGRYTRLPSSASMAVSFNRGVAARVGDSVIAFGDDTTSSRGDPQVAWLDGEPLDLSPGTTELPGGTVLTVGAGDGYGVAPAGVDLPGLGRQVAQAGVFGGADVAFDAGVGTVRASSSCRFRPVVVTK